MRPILCLSPLDLMLVLLDRLLRDNSYQYPQYMYLRRGK